MRPNFSQTKVPNRRVPPALDLPDNQGHHWCSLCSRLKGGRSPQKSWSKAGGAGLGDHGAFLRVHPSLGEPTPYGDEVSTDRLGFCTTADETTLSVLSRSHNFASFSYLQELVHPLTHPVSDVSCPDIARHPRRGKSSSRRRRRTRPGLG